MVLRQVANAKKFTAIFEILNAWIKSSNTADHLSLKISLQYLTSNRKVGSSKLKLFNLNGRNVDYIFRTASSATK